VRKEASAEARKVASWKRVRSEKKWARKEVKKVASKKKGGESKKRVTREKKGGMEGSWEGTVRVKSNEWRRSEEGAKRQERKSGERRGEEKVGA
jgi:hypothetical protein